MAFLVKSNKEQRDFEQPKPGLHVGRCVSLTDLGMQPGYEPGTEKHKIRLKWKLAELDSAGSNLSIIKEYTASLGERANLRKDLQAWFGPINEEDVKEGIDVESMVVGEPCQLSVTEKTSKQGNIYMVVTAIMPIAQGQEAPELDAEEVETPF